MVNNGRGWELVVSIFVTYPISIFARWQRLIPDPDIFSSLKFLCIAAPAIRSFSCCPEGFWKCSGLVTQFAGVVYLMVANWWPLTFWLGVFNESSFLNKLNGYQLVAIKPHHFGLGVVDGIITQCLSVGRH